MWLNEIMDKKPKIQASKGQIKNDKGENPTSNWLKRVSLYIFRILWIINHLQQLKVKQRHRYSLNSANEAFGSNECQYIKPTNSMNVTNTVSLKGPIFRDHEVWSWKALKVSNWLRLVDLMKNLKIWNRLKKMAIYVNVAISHPNSV